MRHLNTGEIKLFNVAEDMGESKDLSQTMPEKTADMIRRLDAYLEKVGAWTMEEVYETRLDELENWITKHHKDIKEIKAKLAKGSGSSTELKKELKKAKDNLARHQSTFDKVTANKTSGRWF